MSLSTYERDDPTFVADLQASDRIVLRVAQWLRQRGNTVAIPPVRVRPHVDQMSAYADDGDLYLVKIDPCRVVTLERVEVKGRSLNVTTRTDYPYGTVIVDVAHAWDKADPKPVAYIIVNHAETHCAVVRQATAEAWVRTERFDAAKNRSFYECPATRVSFFKL